MHLFYSMSICSIRGRFFFTVHSSYKYVQLNQRNTLEHKNKKSFQQEQTFFLQCSSLFFHVSVSSPLNEESMYAPCARTTACVQWLFAVCVCYCVNNAQWRSYINNAEAAYPSKFLLFRFHNLELV